MCSYRKAAIKYLHRLWNLLVWTVMEPPSFVTGADQKLDRTEIHEKKFWSWKVLYHNECHKPYTFKVFCQHLNRFNYIFKHLGHVAFYYDRVNTNVCSVNVHSAFSCILIFRCLIMIMTKFCSYCLSDVTD